VLLALSLTHWTPPLAALCLLQRILRGLGVLPILIFMMLFPIGEGGAGVGVCSGGDDSGRM